MHLGCGQQVLRGWTNLDLANGDYRLDLGRGTLPFADASFGMVVTRHFIEHLELASQLLPLLKDIHRCLRPGGVLWATCPDIRKICTLYVADGGQSLKAARIEREFRRGLSPAHPWSLDDYSRLVGTPASHMINCLFFQGGEHCNLFDFELLSWVLGIAGFVDVRQACERELLIAAPDLPARYDDESTLYVTATKGV